MAVKIAFHPLHELYVVKGTGLDQLVDLYMLQGHAAMRTRL